MVAGKAACTPCDRGGLDRAAEILTNGGIVAVPTETVYGLAADATRPEAIRRIYAAKGRPANNPLIVHVGRRFGNISALSAAKLIDVSDYASSALQMADALMAKYWPGPLTVVLQRGALLPPEVSGGLPTVGFRMPDHPCFLDVLEACGLPLAAPSANRSNRISPTAAAHVMDELGDRIPLVLDGGACRVGVESTIVSIGPDGELKLLRQGGLPAEAIAAVAGKEPQTSAHSEGVLAAPGMMREHYAPNKQLILLNPADQSDAKKRLAAAADLTKVGVLTLGPHLAELGQVLLAERFTVVKQIDFPDSDVVIANGLFAALRQLDGSDADSLIVMMPAARDSGLWPAIFDRLNRAAARWDILSS